MVARRLLVLVLFLSFCAPLSSGGTAGYCDDGGVAPWPTRTRRGGGGRRGSSASAAPPSLSRKSIPHIVPPNPLVDVHTGVWAGDDADADGMVLENQPPSTPVWAGQRDEGYEGGTPVLEEGGEGGDAMVVNEPSSWEGEGEEGDGMLLDTPERGHGGGQRGWPRRGAGRGREYDYDDDDDDDDEEEEEEKEERSGPREGAGGQNSLYDTVDAEWRKVRGGVDVDGSDVGFSDWPPSRLEVAGQKMDAAGQQQQQQQQQQSSGVSMPGRRGSGTLSSPRGLPIAPDDYLYPAPKREFLSFTPARGVRKRLATGAGPLVGGDGQDAAGGYGEDEGSDVASEGVTAGEWCMQGDALLDDRAVSEAVAWESSLKAYVKAWEVDPSHPGTLTRLAYVAERSHPQQFEAAKSMYAFALRANPAHLDALVLSGHSYQCIERDPQAAREQYRRALSLHPSSAVATVLLASLLLEEYKEPTAAGQLFERAAKLDPLRADAWHGRAMSMMHGGKDDAAAEAMLRRALRVDPSHSSSLFELARLRWRLHGDAEQAMSLARRAIGLDPTSCHRMCQYGYMQAVSGGDLLAAEETYRRAIRLGPDCAMPYAELAQVLVVGVGGMAAERKQEIQMLYDRALDLEPRNPKTLYQMAMFIEQQVQDGDDTADYSRPEELLQLAYQEAPDDPYVLTAYGQLLAGPGLDREQSYTRKAVNKRRAGDFFARAAALSPHRFEFHLNYAGFLEIHQRDYDSALDAYQRSARCNPSSDEVQFRLGKLLQYHLRDFEDAEKAYQACLGVAPAHGEALAHYGLLLCNSLRHYSSARKVLERALAILPDHDDAKLGIKFLTLIERAVDRGGQPAPDPKLSKIRQRVKEMM